MSKQVIITTISDVPGREIVETLGVVKGQVVTSRNIGSDLIAWLKSMAGGEMRSYTKMIDNARRIATERMVEEAEQLGADAVIGMMYGTSAVISGAAELLAYGTAVKLKPIR